MHKVLWTIKQTIVQVKVHCVYCPTLVIESYLYLSCMWTLKEVESKQGNTCAKFLS
jgi:hypothetical protein